LYTLIVRKPILVALELGECERASH